ncbi:MAG: iron ABC transporter permease [Planctomycetota bacterium]|nr:iron ABC transporter permease [Planctomycetota bacterium]MDP7249780.1 iron ABC transporter permease [Planctomycetota bacterium]
MSRHRFWILTAIAMVSLAVVVIAPFIGIISTPPRVLWGDNGSELAADVFWRLRLPRVALGFLAGAALAAAGMAFQAMFRNALATPFTLGVSSGAALGATLCIHLGWSFSILGVSAVSLSAFFGALGSLMIVYGITLCRSGFSTTTMLLAGVAVSLFFSSLILFMQYMTDLTSSFRILRWLMGGMEVVGFRAVTSAFPFVVSGVAVVFYFARELNLFAVGDDFAVSRGVDATRTKTALFLATTLMVGGVVALCGPIGFIGMMAPHICRLMIGSEHRYLLPATVLFGGMFLVLCDLLARMLIAPAEIPVGVITALLGGPFFVWLLLRRSSSGAFLT